MFQMRINGTDIRHMVESCVTIMSADIERNVSACDKWYRAMMTDHLWLS